MKHLYVLWVLVALLAATSVFALIRVQQALHAEHATQLQVQHEQGHQNDALRSIMCRAEHVVRTQPGIPASERRSALKFYEQALAGANLKPCS